MIRIEYDTDISKATQDALIAWVEANGIDSMEMAPKGFIEIERDGTIRYLTVAYGKSGEQLFSRNELAFVECEHHPFAWASPPEPLTIPFRDEPEGGEPDR